MTAWFKTLFIFSSLGPLYLFVAIGIAAQHHWSQPWQWTPSVGAGFAFAGLFALSVVVFLRLRGRLAAQSVTRQVVSDPERLDESVLSYMLSYIPPLLIDDLTNPAKVVPAIGFYVVLIAMMALTNAVHVNPYFLIAGLRISRVTLSDGARVIVISPRPSIREGELIPLHAISQGALYYAPKEDS